MTTSYSLSDSAPREAGGQKFIAWINDSASQLDFGLPRGIAVESLGSGSMNVLHLAVGTHTVGSKVSKPLVMIGGAYTESPSLVGTGNAQQIRTNRYGHVLTVPGSALKSANYTSANVHATGSALLASIHIAAIGNINDKIVVKDGTTEHFTFYLTSASYSTHFAFPVAVYMATNISHAVSLTAAGSACSVIVTYMKD